MHRCYFPLGIEKISSIDTLLERVCQTNSNLRNTLKLNKLKNQHLLQQLDIKVEMHSLKVMSYTSRKARA